MICSHCGFDDEGLNPFSKCLRCGLPFGTTVTDDRFPEVVTGDEDRDCSR